MLKEARIVMPHTGYEHTEHAELRDGLVRAFGGYTETAGNGAWFSDGRTHNDMVRVYDVAIEAERDASWDQLFQIAMAAGRELNQEAVYVRYPDGTVDVAKVPGPGETTWREGYAEGGHPTKAVNAPDHLAKPLGTKRLPQVGEVWRNRANALVAVLSQATVLDGGYNVVTLSKSDTARNPGHVYLVDMDGHIHRDHSGAPGDLVSFVTRFDS